MDNTLLDKTKKALRALLISAPRGVPKRLLLTDYRMVMGKELPFRSMGFRSLDDFIRGVPDVMREAAGVGGEPTLFPVLTAETEQIARFVATQKKPKLKKSLAPPSIVAPCKSSSGFSAKAQYGRPRAKSRRNNYSSSRNTSFFGGGGQFTQSFPPKSSFRSRGRFGSTPSFSSVQLNVSVGTRPLSVEPPKVSSSSSMWKDEYRSAHHVSIAELWKYMTNLSLKLVRVTGYICTTYRIDKVGRGIKYLLYSDVGPVTKESDGRGLFPAVMLYFYADTWNKEEHPRLFMITSETRLTVYGSPFVQVSAKHKGKEEPAIKVLYYEESNIGSIASSTQIRTNDRTLSSNPPNVGLVSSNPPNVGLVSKSLKDSVYIMLQKFPSGIYLAKIDGIFMKEFGKAPPPNLKDVVKGLSGVVIDNEIPDHPRVFLKSPLPPPTERSDDSSQPRVPSAGFVTRALRESILRLLESNPSGIPTSQFDEAFVSTVKKDPPPHLVDLALSLPGVFCRDVTGTSIIYLGNPSLASGEGSAHSQTQSAGFVSDSLRQKVYELLEKGNGVYVKQLGKLYKIRYKTEAPQNIMEIVRTLDFVRCEEEIPGYPVLYLKAGATPPKPTSGDKVVTSLPLTLPGATEFNSEEDVFDVSVTYINSVTSFYVQLYGQKHSEKFLRMMNELEQYLQKSGHRSKGPVQVDQLYGYLWEDEGGERVWCRALVRSVRGNNAHVMFPDYGNSDFVPVSGLKELSPSFYNLPFQAVQCCLHGLTDENEEVNKKFNELALNVRCTAQVMDSSGSRVSVELMDSDPSIHETMNSILLKVLHPISTLEPTLPDPGEPMVPVFLTDIDMDGVAVLQVQGPGYNHLQRLMTAINETYQDKGAGPDIRVSDVREGLICCVPYEDDGKWYRVQVVKIINSNLVTVYYVDYGNEDNVKVSQLRPPIENDLFSLPFQSVKCTLHGLPPEGGKWTTAAINLLWDKENNLNVSVVSKGSPGVLPSVKLWLSSEEEELDLNQWLLEQSDIFYLSDEVLTEMSAASLTTSAVTTPLSSSGQSTNDLPATLPRESLERRDPVMEALPKLSIQAVASRENKSSMDSELVSEVSSVSSDSHSARLVFSPHTPSGSTSPCSLLSTSSQAPHTPLGSPLHLVSPPPGNGVHNQLPSVRLPLNELTQVLISWIESPDNFVVQLPDNLSQLEKMDAELNAMLNSSVPSLAPSALCPGLTCCAISSIDEQWHRVAVVGLSADSALVLVDFLDYGGREEVLKSSLKPLPSQFTKLPVQGIKCRCSGTTTLLYVSNVGSTEVHLPQVDGKLHWLLTFDTYSRVVVPCLPPGSGPGEGGKWNEESIQYFNTFAEKQYFILSKKQNNEVYSVILFDGDVNVNNRLINNQLR